MCPHGVCNLVRRAQGPQNKEQNRGRSRKAGRFNHIPNIPWPSENRKSREHPVRPRGGEIGFSLEEWVRWKQKQGGPYSVNRGKGEGMKGVETG